MSAGIPQPREFDSIGAWFSYLRKEGFTVPVQAPHALSLAQKELGLEPQQAFDWLIAAGLLLLAPNGLAVDLRATNPEFWQRQRQSTPDAEKGID